jgi:hypothetical protein
MNIVVKSALAGAVVVIAYACATPVEIVDDVLRVDPSTFGDGGLPLAGAGGAGGASGTSQGGTGAGTGGSGVAAGGTGGGVGGASAGSGMQASAGAGTLPVGTGGTATGVGGATAQGGAAGGAPGTPATAGTGGTPAAAGTGATGGVFDAASCDFDELTGCEDLACLAACPTNDGGSCSTRCQTLITCVATDPACAISEADPLCAARVGGTPAACTQEADAAGGATTTQTTAPAFVARQFVECICSVPRP